MNKFFKAPKEIYEQIRHAMDAESGYPSAAAETWFAPANSAQQDRDGNCLIAAIPAIAQQFATAGAEELTAEQYAALLPQPDPEDN